MDFNWDAIASLPEMMEMLPGGFYVYRAEGKGEVLAINKAALKIYGCENFDEFKKLTGGIFRGMVHPLDYDEIERRISEQIFHSEDSGRYDYVEYRIIRADGKTRLVTDYGRLVHSEHYGEIFCVFIDDASEKMARVTKSLAPQFFKITKVNLTRDAFVTIKQPADDHTPKSKKFSSDFVQFLQKGFVHSDDKSYVENSMSLENLKNYFLKGGTNKVLRYRRKIAQSIYWVTMNITRAEEYTGENQVVVIFERIADDGFVALHNDYKKAEVIAGLSSGYDSIYIVDTEQNAVKPYMLATPLSKQIDETLDEKYSDFTEANTLYARKFVCPPDRQRYLLQTSVDYILRMLTHSRRYEVMFRAIKASQVVYMQLSVCRIDEGNLSRVFLGYKNITKQFVEESDKTVARHVDEILHFLADDFLFLNEIDLETETEKQFFLNENSETSIPRWSDSLDFRDCINAFAQKYVAPHDLERFLESTRLESLKKSLSVKQPFILVYDAVVNGVQRRFEGHFVLQKTLSGKEKILIGTKDITNSH